eukprot:TRINITY_DN40647_c0_g1_i3.p1 TRINITY_DN40647_c0_g1~~TRINITY_DN40647_c0_g1_i3.p1  ORF type:complete len:102 (-),score=6.49 TRINITY_DN40647_c0_g1_i3:21-326(-)
MMPHFAAPLRLPQKNKIERHEQSSERWHIEIVWPGKHEKSRSTDPGPCFQDIRPINGLILCKLVVWKFFTFSGNSSTADHVWINKQQTCNKKEYFIRYSIH